MPLVGYQINSMSSNTLDIYLDTETTGIDVYNDEIIQAYFEVYNQGELVDTYELLSSVRKWSFEAEAVHGISQRKAMSYPSKNRAYFSFLRWLPTNFRFITYANKNTIHGCINFDVAMLQNELDLQGYSMYYLQHNYLMKPALSVHDIVKRLKKKIGIKGSLSQENVYKHLFDDEYNAHNAVDDVKALVRIHRRLIELEHEDQSILTLC